MNTERSGGLALAAIFTGPGKPLELREFPVPKPGRGEVLVDITCATICGSDQHTFHGRRTEPTPCVLGHEIVGRIVAFGPEAPRNDLAGSPLAPGDRVTWTLAASCGECFYCKKGLPQKCEHLFKYGHVAATPGREFTGGFAECCILRAGTGILRLPDDLSDALAAPANCATATVAASLRLAGPVEDATVVVMGCGVLGLNAIAMASAAGATKIIGCDISESRAESAMAFGATGFALPGAVAAAAKDVSHGRGADVMLEFSGSSDAVAAGIATLRTGGTGVVAGTASPGKPVELAPEGLVRRMLTLKGLHNYAPGDLITAVDFLAANKTRYPFESFKGECHHLRDINAAFEAAGKSAGKRVSVCPYC
jgi:putative phosphonate catabolism associated alcohol dehydrogenase